MSSQSKPLSTYFLNENDSEISRLNGQYLWFKSIWDYPQLLPFEIDVARVSRVLDAAAGTGAWALDFVSLPGVRDRDVQVFACDVSTAKFPDTDAPEVKRIKFFECDITRPFHDDMLGTFDLINLNYMSYALTKRGWKVALQNLHDLLKPGGYLIVRDSDLVMYNDEHPAPPCGQKPDITAIMNGPAPLSNFNRIFSGCALQRDFVIGLSYYLPRFLEEASLVIQSSKRAVVPFGDHSDKHKGLNGSSLSAFKAFSLDNFNQVFSMLTLAMLRGGTLELADGTRITSEEDRRALMEDLKRAAVDGGYTVLNEWVIVRPQEAT
ncbi:S-adenosyl-L-methionine-dependent methyltransferase [Gloeopeniophorella convolvens]|nr:S-adenosyl-L-methionine-dependent methyltransferase [Gloeopeniophorella convolvens]